MVSEHVEGDRVEHERHQAAPKDGNGDPVGIGSVDEARYHPGTNTVLLRRDSELATVLVMTESEMVTDGGDAR